jgi:CheY-like chemotaxis protein/anti-sigma regulatory factor (Ser/Thr protein kinase)
MDGAETVRRIQGFSRKGEDDKKFTQVDMNKIRKDAIEFTSVLWKDAAEAKGIKITIKKEFSSLAPVAGSASELREVFTNLITNATESMPEGGDIRIKTFMKGSSVVITFGDTGTGIPEALQDRIFDPFFTTKGVQSTGLGMSVSYGIINRHRGTIKVDSVEGKGTTFTIQLPQTEKAVKEEKVQLPQKEQKKARILVIEDEGEVRKLLGEILMSGGHEVETAPDGSSGIKVFENKAFDLVFTDLGMPGLSGWQVAERIKLINGRVPVALITGWNVQMKEYEPEDKWVDFVIQKPFEVIRVLNLVQEAMRLSEQFHAA